MTITKEQAIELARDAGINVYPEYTKSFARLCNLAIAHSRKDVEPVALENSQEAADAIWEVLKEYNHPANTANAARAGWRACRLSIRPTHDDTALLRQALEVIEDNTRFPCAVSTMKVIHAMHKRLGE